MKQLFGAVVWNLKSYRGLARVLNPNSTSHLLARFIGKVELIGRIKLEPTPSREERPGDRRDRV